MFDRIVGFSRKLRNIAVGVLLLGMALLYILEAVSLPAVLLWLGLFTIWWILWKTKQNPRIVYIAQILFLAFHAECMMQLAIERKFFLLWDYRRVADFCLYGAVFFAAGLIGKRKSTGLMAAQILLIVITTLNFVLTYFRGKPFYFPDIYSAGTALDVIDSYTFPMSKMQLVCVGMMLSTFWIIDSAEEWKFDFNSNIWKRAVVFCGSILVVWCAWFFEIPTRLGMTSYYFSTTNYWGYTFTMSLLQSHISEPAEYDPEILPMDLSSDSASLSDSVRPNVLMIMNESFADLRVIADYEKSGEVMPFFDELIKRPGVANGYLYTSIFGGNTANTEFEVLTGASMYFLPSGTTSYNLYCNKPVASLASYFSEIGYQTIAFHPSNRTNYSRHKVYPNLGFETSFFLEDFPEMETLRTFTSDMADYRRVMEFFDQKAPDDRLFLFNVTVQNHGPFSINSEDFENRIDLDYGTYPLTEQYLSCLNYSDRALEELIAYLEHYPEPVAVVFFGDHQSKIEVAFYQQLFGGRQEAFLEENEKILKYAVPYFIWTNYGANISEKGKNMSANYFGAYMVDILGLPQTAQHKYLNLLRSQWPIITCFGASNNADNIQLQMPVLNTYEKICYNLLFDHENTWSDYYELSR